MKQRSLIFTAICAIALSMVFTGCKEDTVIKAGITPGDNTLGTVAFDTMQLITKTVFIDTLKTSEKISGVRIVHACGNVYDPYFGKTNAGIYFQVLPTTNNFTFSANGFTVDSAFVIMSFTGFGWGDRENPEAQKYTVYEVTQDMSISTDYYSNQTLGVDRNNPVGSTTIDLKSGFRSDTANKYKYIAIPVNKSFIDKVVTQIGTSTFATESSFLSYFKGLYIEPDTNQKHDLLPYFFLDGNEDYARFAIEFYYRENGSSEVKKAYFNYLRDKTANFNWIKRNYNGTPAQAWINKYLSTINTSDDTVLLQNEPGAAIDIRIPNIQSLPVSSVIKAELVITKVLTGDPADTLLEPNRLVPTGVNSNGTIYNIQDYSGTSTAGTIGFVDGTRRVETEGTNSVIRYRINLPRELQKAITDKRNELHLRITSAQGFPGAYRLVAGGSTNGTYKLKLNIVYSKPN